jgi:hypothetical protein
VSAGGSGGSGGGVGGGGGGGAPRQGNLYRSLGSIGRAL